MPEGLSGTGVDGMRPPGAATGATSQAGEAMTGAGFFFSAAIAAYRAALIVTWRFGAGEHTTWR